MPNASRPASTPPPESATCDDNKISLRRDATKHCCSAIDIIKDGATGAFSNEITERAICGGYDGLIGLIGLTEFQSSAH